MSASESVVLNPAIPSPVKATTAADGRPAREKADDVAQRPSWRTWLSQLWRRPAGSPPRPAGSPDAGTTPLKLRVGVVSTVGIYRDHNEDNFYLPEGTDRDPDGGLDHRAVGAEIAPAGGKASLFVVADGMGGQLGGEKASQMAVDIIPKELGRRLATVELDDKDVQRAIRDAVAAANHEILGLSVVQAEYDSMGTTVVLALFRNERIYVAGLGDSRAYLVRDGAIEQLTEDHSLAWALFKAGTITAEELPHHKFNHVLYLYLGSKDARDGPEQIRTSGFRSGDRFLLASDGLTGVVTDADLARLVSAHDDPELAAKALIKLALDNQSKDNVTCLVIHVV